MSSERKFFVTVEADDISDEGWGQITDQWLTELEDRDISYKADVEGDA